jgi:hypothetical protein
MQCGQGKPFTITSTNSRMGGAAIKSYKKGGIVTAVEGRNPGINDATRERAESEVRRRPIIEALQQAAGRAQGAAAKNTAPTRNKVVTKEQLQASGLDLRDYMNQQQGLTRRGGTAPDAYGKEQQYQRAQEAAQTPEGKARRSAMAESQALEGSYPVESVAAGAASLLRAGVGKLAGRSAAKEATRVEPYRAQSASRAVSTGAETPVTFLGGTAGRVMNAPRLAGKSTDVVRRDMVR